MQAGKTILGKALFFASVVGQSFPLSLFAIPENTRSQSKNIGVPT